MHKYYGYTVQTLKLVYIYKIWKKLNFTQNIVSSSSLSKQEQHNVSEYKF